MVNYELKGFVKGTPKLGQDGFFYVPTFITIVNPMPPDEVFKKIHQQMRLAWIHGPPRGRELDYFMPSLPPTSGYGVYSGRELPIFDGDRILAYTDSIVIRDRDVLDVDDINLNFDEVPSDKVSQIQLYLLRRAKEWK